MKFRLLVISALAVLGAQAAPKAQYLVRNQTQQTLGYKIGEKAFRTCDGKNLEIRDSDKIMEAPGETCDNLPTPVLATAQLVAVDLTAQRIVVEIAGFKNTLKLDRETMKQLQNRKPNEGIAVMAVGGIPAAVAERAR